MVQLMRKAAERIPAERLWVNPDCGLKTRQWSKVLPALAQMVGAARELRATVTVQAYARYTETASRFPAPRQE